jgi:hypothetical protein
MTNRARPIVACRCSMPSPALYRPVSSGPLTCSSTRSIGRRPLDQAADIGNIGRHDVVGAIGKKPPPGAGAAQCGDGDVEVVGGEGVAEGQREKHTRNGGQRSACASSSRVRNTGSAVALKASVDERPQARADGCAGLHEAPGRLYSSIFRKFSSSSLAYSAKFSWIRRRRPRDIWQWQ